MRCAVIAWLPRAHEIDSHMIMTALMVMLSSNWHSRDFSICQQFHRSELAYHTALQDPPHNIQPFSLVTYVG